MNNSGNMQIRNLILSGIMLIGLTVGASAQIQLDRPKVEQPLDNPYTLGVQRERIIETVRDVLKGCGISLREEGAGLSNGQSNGKIITQPVVFTRGVTTRNNLEYLAAMPSSEVRNWLQGRYFIEITALPLDQKRSQLFIAAHIEGRYADAMAGSVWVEGQSNGRLEDEVLRGLAGKILGIDLSLKTATNQRRILNCTY
jgi:hypothetical protein